jgi:hypothetical protein
MSASLRTSKNVAQKTLGNNLLCCTAFVLYKVVGFRLQCSRFELLSFSVVRAKRQ